MIAAAGNNKPPSSDGQITHGRQINASNTGITGVGILRSSLISTGSTTYSTNGQVVSGRLFTGSVIIAGDSITLDGCQVETSGSSVIGINVTGSNVTIKNCTVLAPSGSMYQAIHAEDGTGSRLLRCDVSKGENNMTIETDNVTVEECYVHDSSAVSSPGGHKDCIEVYGGSNHNVIRSKLVHLKYTETAAINIAPWWGNTSVVNVNIDDCYLGGGHMHIVVDLQSTGVLQKIRFRRK